MRLKGERAVFRQILAGDPFKAQICHLGLKSGPLEAKMVRFEAKNDRFEAKRVIWTVLEVKFGKMISVFFLKFFMRLKGERAVFRQILAGDPLEAQICPLEPPLDTYLGGKLPRYPFVTF